MLEVMADLSPLPCCVPRRSSPISRGGTSPSALPRFHARSRLKNVSLILTVRECIQDKRRANECADDGAFHHVFPSFPSGTLRSPCRKKQRRAQWRPTPGNVHFLISFEHATASEGSERQRNAYHGWCIKSDGSTRREGQQVLFLSLRLSPFLPFIRKTGS